MNTVFPFGFPGPTAFYLVVYVVTLIIHVVFMNYVLAGATYLFLASGMGRERCEACVWQQILKDWMPFATGLAITAGVAPLLFLQILYQREFYSANLLLSHRWMAILPVLLVSFYLLYLQKTHWLKEKRGALPILVRTGVFLGFSFIAWSWTENHLLSLDSSIWPGMYARGDLFYRSWSVPSRLAVWYLGAFPTLACCLMWQAATTPNKPMLQAPAAVRRLGLTAIGGLIASSAAALIYGQTLAVNVRETQLVQLIGPYFVIALAGGLLQFIPWAMILRNGIISRWQRWTITAGCGLAILGMTVVREGIRLTALGDQVVSEFHADAARVGGLFVFLFFFVLNAILISVAVHQVRRHILSPSPEAADVAAGPHSN